MENSPEAGLHEDGAAERRKGVHRRDPTTGELTGVRRERGARTGRAGNRLADTAEHGVKSSQLFALTARGLRCLWRAERTLLQGCEILRRRHRPRERDAASP